MKQYKKVTRTDQFCFVGANFRQNENRTVVGPAHLLLDFLALKSENNSNKILEDLLV